MKPILAILALSLSGCSTWSAYNSHVAARQDSLSGYAGQGEVGGKFIHRVEYR